MQVTVINMKRLLGILILICALLLSSCAAKAAAEDGSGTASETDAETAPYVNELFYTLQKEPGIMDMVMFRVGKSDAMLISTEHFSILIDTGEKNDFDADKIIEYCNFQDITVLDAVICSNLLTDNIGGFEKISEALEIREVIAPAYNATGHRYTKFLRSVVASGALYTPLSDCTVRTFDDLEITFYPADNPLVYNTEQDMSLVLSLAHGDNRFLLCGNIRSSRITEVMNTVDAPYDVVKLPDHGFLSEDSDTYITEIAEPFLMQYTPEYALISDS
ncbi:MAG: ComEC/Rec2 family competence protein, partial [Eubacteriales bacterium]